MSGCFVLDASRFRSDLTNTILMALFFAKNAAIYLHFWSRYQDHLNTLMSHIKMCEIKHGELFNPLPEDIDSVALTITTTDQSCKSETVVVFFIVEV